MKQVIVHFLTHICAHGAAIVRHLGRSGGLPSRVPASGLVLKVFNPVAILNSPKNRHIHGRARLKATEAGGVHSKVEKMFADRGKA